MQKVLVQWNTNWADEMDIQGFQILTVDEWNDYKSAVEKRKNFEIYVGTNEEISYDSGEDLLEELEVTLITKVEVEIIEKFFGDGGGFTEFMSAAEDDEEYDDEQSED